ncbi:MAG: ANTAR domain-containing protein [Clostridiales bacterium]|nr:ANTAR domain-containing protein [Clostridia bacterium]MBQ6563227.1 ANTAR domain-containing protein [Clostridia bacterium]MCR4883264.1 ANTAR domain-containing protein [Clostridiales bacterium]
MARIIITSASAQVRSQLTSLLSSSGFSVFRCCGNGSELRRSINECEDGIVILAGSIPGCNPDELQWDYGEHIHFLLIGKPEALDSFEHPGLFRLHLPLSSQAVIGAVEMLTQLHQMHLPKRSETEKQLVERAKKHLMHENGYTEAQAHRYLQQHAMQHGMRMADLARRIIQESSETEEST